MSEDNFESRSLNQDFIGRPFSCGGGIFLLGMPDHLFSSLPKLQPTIKPKTRVKDLDLNEKFTCTDQDFLMLFSHSLYSFFQEIYSPDL